MKRIFFLACIFGIIFLTSCTDQKGTEISPKQSDFSEDQALNNITDTFDDVLIEQDKNYELYSDSDSVQNGYYYKIKDNFGDVIDEGYYNWRGVEVSVKNNILVLTYITGGSGFKQRFYDLANGRVSSLFEKPVSYSDELVGYFEINENNKIILIVQSIFNKKDYYREFDRNFSPDVINDQCHAVFLNNDSTLKITYWTISDNKEITEEIDL